MKKLHKNIIIITISFALGIFTSFFSISRSIKTTVNITDLKAEKNFKVNFKSKTKIPSNAYTFTVEKKDLSQDYLIDLATSFDVNNNFSQDDTKYYFENQLSKLTIFKKDNLLKFVTINYENTTDEQTLINKSIDILNKYNLTFEYDDILYEKNNDLYEITFISSLYNLKNYGFQNKVVFDLNASLLTVEVYLNDFKKLGNLKIKPINEAVKYLKIDSNELTELISYELVYVYNKSILEPAYRILGQTEQGDTTELFLNAYF